VVLADDHPGVAAQLRGVLEPEFEVVAVMGDGEALVAAASSARIGIRLSERRIIAFGSRHR
jgi:DNA-binding NarL/FixJ family response regulator